MKKNDEPELYTPLRDRKAERIGDAVCALSRKHGLTNEDFEIFESVQDKAPAEPLTLKAETIDAMNEDRHGQLTSLHDIEDPMANLNSAIRNPTLEQQEQALSYDRWFRAKVQAALDDPRPGIPHDEAMAKVEQMLQAKRAVMHNPPHPGEGLREDVLPTLNMTVTALAKHLGYSRVQLSNVINCRSAISADLAWRLELAGAGKAHMWLGRQSAYDLWQAQHKEVPAMTRLKTI